VTTANSPYLTIETDFTDLEVLCAALRCMRFIPRFQGLHCPWLYNCLDLKEQEKAHLKVGHEQIGTYSSDLGFFFNGKNWQMIIDKFDQDYGTARPFQGLGPQFLPKLQGLYQKMSGFKARQGALALNALLEGYSTSYRDQRDIWPSQSLAGDVEAFFAEFSK
jgi:hypothetical protein